MTVKELIEELQYEVEMGRSDWPVHICDLDDYEREYEINEVYGSYGEIINLSFKKQPDTDDWE